MKHCLVDMRPREMGCVVKVTLTSSNWNQTEARSFDPPTQ